MALYSLRRLFSTIIIKSVWFICESGMIKWLVKSKLNNIFAETDHATVLGLQTKFLVNLYNLIYSLCDSDLHT